MTAARRRSPRPDDARRSRSRWWLVPIGLFTVMFAAWGTMIHLALDDPSFAVEPDYYQKAIAWDRHMAQEVENDRLGWRAEVATVPKADGTVEVGVDLDDRHGRALTGADVRIETFHNARAAHVVNAHLAEQDAGYYAASLPMRRPGLWEIRLQALRGAERYTRVVVQDVETRR